MTTNDILEIVKAAGGTFRVEGDKLILEADRGAIGQEVKETIRAHKAEIIRALSPPKRFNGAPLKEGLTDFVYLDGKPVQIKVKPTGLFYDVLPMDERCQTAGYCRHSLMPDGWCSFYPIFIGREIIGYCRATIPANSQNHAARLIN